MAASPIPTGTRRAPTMVTLGRPERALNRRGTLATQGDSFRIMNEPIQLPLRPDERYTLAMMLQQHCAERPDSDSDALAIIDALAAPAWRGPVTVSVRSLARLRQLLHAWGAEPPACVLVGASVPEAPAIAEPLAA